MKEVPRYIVHDLKTIQEDLGDHEVTSKTFVSCPICDARHYQRHDVCTGCGIPVIWKNSSAWRTIWGNPNTAIRRLNKVPATDKAGLLLMEHARQPGFANQSEYSRWMKAGRKLGGGNEMMECVNYVASEGAYGRPLIAHALNLVEKKARETKKPATTTEPEKRGEPKEILR